MFDFYDQKLVNLLESGPDVLNALVVDTETVILELWAVLVRVYSCFLYHDETSLPFT